MAAADTILHNGRIVTLDRGSRVFEAVAIRNGKIVGVGTSAEIAKSASPDTHKVDLKGRTVVPGFFDGHPHMDREGLKSQGGVSLAGLRSIAEIVEAVAEEVKKRQPDEWVSFMPLGDPPAHYLRSGEELKDGRFPTRHDLDPVSPNNPVYIRSIWGWWGTPPYPAVANTRALEMSGVTRDSVAPYKTEILKDSRGELTGVFLDRNRAPLLEYTLFRHLPRFTHHDRVEGIRAGAKTYSALGTTTGYEGHGLTPAVIRAYREVHAQGELPVRMHAPVSVSTAARSDAELVELFYQWGGVASARGMGDDHFCISGVTLDLGDPQLATVLGTGYPYEQWAGFFYQGLTDERFIRLGVEAVRAGLRINTCFCYDLERAIRLFEAIDKEAPLREMRCVAVHLSEGTDEQLRRIKKLGLCATMAPIILYEHAETFGLGKLGERALPAREILDAGIPVTLSTDNLPRPSMLWQMWEILARHNQASNTTQGESRLTREEALRMAAQFGHYLTWEEDMRGSIEVGKVADLAVLDGDPMTCELDKLRAIKTEMTLISGRVVFGER